jgi:hypothetical protein
MSNNDETFRAIGAVVVSALAIMRTSESYNIGTQQIEDDVIVKKNGANGRFSDELVAAVLLSATNGLMQHYFGDAESVIEAASEREGFIDDVRAAVDIHSFLLRTAGV